MWSATRMARSLPEASLSLYWKMCTKLYPSDKQKVVIKSPVRDVLKDQENARRQLENEFRLLSGPLRGQTAIRQLVDRIILSETPEVLQAGVYEYGEMTLHEFHFIEKRRLSPTQIRTMARQLLLGLASMHQLGIVHKGESVW